MLAEVAGVVAGTADRGGLATAQERQAHHAQAGRRRDATPPSWRIPHVRSRAGTSSQEWSGRNPVLAHGMGARHLGGGPLPDHGAVVLGERAQHLHHHPTSGRGRVEVLGKRAEAGTGGLDPLGQVQQGRARHAARSESLPGAAWWAARRASPPACPAPVSPVRAARASPRARPRPAASPRARPSRGRAAPPAPAAAAATRPGAAAGTPAPGTPP